MTPRRFAVIGDPIAQSKSPAMHGAAFAALGLPHTYEALRVGELELPSVVAQLRLGVYEGLSVTIPHKERVLALSDVLDESARRAGAANTLVRREVGGAAVVVAHNTDAPALAGELQSLREQATLRPLRAPGARALVLGSGGAARAAIVALGHHLGVTDLVVRARSFADPARARAFQDAAPLPVRTEPWEPSAFGEATTVAVVQATSAGMRGADPGEAVAAVVAWDALPRDAVAIDAVYAPRDTPFLRAARLRGLASDDGLGMLAGQGALAFELWLGRPAPRAAMRAAIV